MSDILYKYLVIIKTESAIVGAIMKVKILTSLIARLVFILFSLIRIIISMWDSVVEYHGIFKVKMEYEKT